MFLAQQATTAAVVEATGIAESELLHDRHANQSLEHGPRGFVYIDNIGLTGKDLEEVGRLVGCVSRVLCSRGLLTHELCLATRCCDVLGIELDGERLRTRAISAKYEKLRLSLQWVLEQRRVSGQVLERVMGHVTYISLVRRPLLSAFASFFTSSSRRITANQPSSGQWSCRTQTLFQCDATLGK